MTKSKCNFFNKPVINLTPKPSARFKGVKAGEPLKF